jgi:hypothetical protein
MIRRTALVTASSLIGRITARTQGVSIDPAQVPTLLQTLALVPDPRDRRGVIHPLASLLAVAVAAVLANARSVAAIGEWIADVPAAILAALGVVRDPLTGIHRVPDATTIGRVLAVLDGDAFDTAVSRWLVGLHTPSAQAPPRRRAYAADGKTLCGSGPAGSQVHLLAAIDHPSGVVVAQTAVDGKTNEITRFVPLLSAWTSTVPS